MYVSLGLTCSYSCLGYKLHGFELVRSPPLCRLSPQAKLRYRTFISINVDASFIICKAQGSFACCARNQALSRILCLKPPKKKRIYFNCNRMNCLNLFTPKISMLLTKVLETHQYWLPNSHSHCSIRFCYHDYVDDDWEWEMRWKKINYISFFNVVYISYARPC